MSGHTFLPFLLFMAPLSPLSLSVSHSLFSSIDLFSKFLCCFLLVIFTPGPLGRCRPFQSPFGANCVETKAF